MSNSMILAPSKRIGAINLKNLTGGEITWDKSTQDLKKAGWYLKRERNQLEKFVFIMNGIPFIDEKVKKSVVGNFDTLNKKIKIVYDALNGRVPKGPRFNYSDFDIKTSMINSFMNYEIKDKVIKMNYEYIEDVHDSHLKTIDLLALYNSRRIYLDILYKNQDKNNIDIYVSRKLLNDVIIDGQNDDYQIVNGIRQLMINTSRNRLVVRLGFMDKIVHINELQRKVFKTRDMNNSSVSFVLSLGDSALKCSNVKYYDEPEEDEPWRESPWIELVAVAYNMLDYNNNHRVVIAREPTIQHIENILQEKMGNGWYNLDNRDLKLYNEATFNHSFESRISYEDKGSYIKETVSVGVSGINKFEKQVLKKLYSKRRIINVPFKLDDDERGIHIDSEHQIKKYQTFDESEIDEIFEVLKEEIDGRCSIKNMEHDIRNNINLKYIFQKNSNELFYLKLALEDVSLNLPYIKEDDSIYQEHRDRVEYLRKKIETTSKKKVTALLNVVQGLHLTYEEEEEMGKYLSDELDEIDKVSSERNFNFNRKHRNYFSQTEGVLVPNGVPGVTHKKYAKKLLTSERIKAMKEDNRGVYYEFDKVEFINGRKEPRYIIKRKQSFTDKELHLRAMFHLLELNGEKMEFKSPKSSPYSFSQYKVEKEPKFGMPGWFSKPVPYSSQRVRRPKCSIEKLDEEVFGKCTQDGRVIIDFNKIVNKHSSKELAVTNTLVHELAHFERDIFGERYSKQKAYEEYIANSVSINVCEEIFGQSLRRAIVQRDKFFKEHCNKIGATYLPRAQSIIKELTAEITKKYNISKTVNFLFEKNGLPCKIEKVQNKDKGKVYLIKRVVERMKRDHAKKQAAKMKAAYAPYLPKGLLEAFIGEEEDYKAPDTTKKDEVIKMSNDMYKVTKNGFTFYAKGNIEALDYPSVSFAGIREPQPETVKFIKEAVKELSDEYVIISGLALGCDAIAHDACLKNNGITIAVLPTGFNHIVPSSNKGLAQRILNNGGLLISEYPPEAKQAKYKERNRIIAGLSHTVIICEAGNGTVSTFNHAKTMGKNILAQRINTFNNNSFFELGARMYTREWVK